MEHRNIIKNQSRTGVLTPTSIDQKQMPLSRGTVEALETIRGIN